MSARYGESERVPHDRPPLLDPRCVIGDERASQKGHARSKWEAGERTDEVPRYLVGRGRDAFDGFDNVLRNTSIQAHVELVPRSRASGPLLEGTDAAIELAHINLLADRPLPHRVGEVGVRVLEEQALARLVIERLLPQCIESRVELLLTHALRAPANPQVLKTRSRIILVWLQEPECFVVLRRVERLV